MRIETLSILILYVQVSLFAELFNEMLQRDFGVRIYKALISLPEREDKKDKKSKKDERKEKKEEKEEENDEPKPKRRKSGDDKDKKEDKDEKKVCISLYLKYYPVWFHIQLLLDFHFVVVLSNLVFIVLVHWSDSLICLSFIQSFRSFTDLSEDYFKHLSLSPLIYLYHLDLSVCGFKWLNTSILKFRMSARVMF